MVCQQKDTRIIIIMAIIKVFEMQTLSIITHRFRKYGNRVWNPLYLFRMHSSLALSRKTERLTLIVLGNLWPYAGFK